MMSDVEAKFAQAQHAHSTGDHDRASTLLGELLAQYPDQPAFYHLSGLVLKKQGEPERARAAFERGLQLNDANPALHAEYASLLDDLGEAEASLAAYDRAIALAPAMLDAQIDRALVRHKKLDPAGGLDDLLALAERHPQSGRIWLNIAVMARTIGRLDVADDAVDRVLAIAPGTFKALRIRAQLAVDRGRPAVELFREARTVDPDDPAAVTGEASALVSEGRRDEAIALLDGRLANEPQWYDGHQILAQIRWQSGDGEAFVESYRTALRDEPRDMRLWAGLTVATARALGHQHALPLVEEARRAAGNDPILDNLEANSLCELGELDQAGLLYEQFMELDDPVYQLPLIRFLLKTRKFDAAQKRGLKLVESGQGPEAWPYISIAWRMLDDPRWQWLEGERDLPQAFDLEDLVPELPALAERLRSLHRWRVHPFAQSLRGGTQTDDVLFTREEPEIVSLVAHIRRAVSRYVAQLPPHDAEHPVLSRSRDDFRFTGSWSVRLTDSGFHVNHIHNQGWISSALYVALPSTIGGGADAQDGWLAIGEPPRELGLDLPPLKLVEPKPGRLVLFPSIMWHGTRPFSAGERLTVAFDVAPA